MFYTYVLQSKLDGNLYYGYTEDLTERFEQHSNGQVTSTKDRRPLKLIYYEACCTQKDALAREKYFKTFRSRQFLAKRLKSYFTDETNSI